MGIHFIKIFKKIQHHSCRIYILVLCQVFGILIVMELQANIPHGSVSSQTIALMTAVYSFYLLRGGERVFFLFRDTNGGGKWGAKQEERENG